MDRCDDCGCELDVHESVPHLNGRKYCDECLSNLCERCYRPSLPKVCVTCVTNEIKRED